MKAFHSEMFVALWFLILKGCILIKSASLYDYSASIDCLEEPLEPQYGGSLVTDPGFDSGLNDWNVFGSAKIMLRKSATGNNYMVAYNRSTSTDSFSHLFHLQRDNLYTFSAWFQLNEGQEIVSAFIKDPNGQYVIVGSVVAKHGCWSMLKGGFTSYDSMNATFLFKCNNTQVELWMDNVSLHPFTKVEWQDQQQKSIEMIRKRKLKIHVTDKNGVKVKGANISINQTRPLFLIGCGSPQSILDYKPYQEYFTSRFTAVTFHNEMKWYFTEVRQGQENYTIPDAMVSFFKSNGIAIRGHNILWDSKTTTPSWARNLPPEELQRAAVRRITSVVSRYSGDLIAWDVMNENLHNTFFEDELGQNASAMFYHIVRSMDAHTPLFLNEYNTLEYPGDLKVIPSKYVEKIKEIRAFPGNENLVIPIGLQGHFLLRPNVSHMRATLDVLGSTNMPIWLTELDLGKGPDQATQLEDVMREAFSHPAVEGIIVWGGWKPTACNQTCLDVQNGEPLPKGCAQMCLINNDFKILPAGEVVDKLIGEWRSTNVRGVTDQDGVFEESVFHGEYSLTYSHPLKAVPATTTFNVTEGRGPLDLYVHL